MELTPQPEEHAPILPPASRIDKPISTKPAMELTPQPEDPAPIPPPASRIDKPIPTEVSYRSKLRSTRNRALVVAGLQKISRFLGICALTWASVVLLGGFASALKILDFYLISFLLLLEAARLTTIEFFSKLLTKTLFHEGRRPEDFEFKDLQNFWSYRLDLVGQACASLLALLNLTSAIVRIAISGHGDNGFTERDQQAGQVSNVSPALYTFYVLVVLNSATAIISSIMRPFFRQSSEDSLTSYHDEVYKVAMTSGLPDADDIDVLEFGFNKLAGDHARNIRPITIKSRNSELIKFIYYSENGVGITCEHLRSKNVWKQVVASALPGFWALESKIEKQVALFWALQDRLYGAGKAAEMAANSIWSLSKTWALENRLPSAGKAAELAANSKYSSSKTSADIKKQHPFLIVDPNRGNQKNVVDSVIDLVLHPIKSSVLFQLRALEGCCRSPRVLEHIYKIGDQDYSELRKKLQNLVLSANQESGDENTQLSRPEELCSKLLSILYNGRTRQTTKMYAASALHALLCFGGELKREVNVRLRDLVDKKIDLTELMEVTEGCHSRPYVWLDEKIMLEELRKSLGLAELEHWPRIRVVMPDGTDMDLSQSINNNHGRSSLSSHSNSGKDMDLWGSNSRGKDTDSVGGSNSHGFVSLYPGGSSGKDTDLLLNKNSNGETA